MTAEKIELVVKMTVDKAMGGEELTRTVGDCLGSNDGCEVGDDDGERNQNDHNEGWNENEDEYCSYVGRDHADGNEDGHDIDDR